MTEKIYDYLKLNNMLAETIDLDACSDLFRLEIENGLSGKRSSLAMLSSHIAMPRKLPQNHDSVVIDAGGTHLRVGLMHFDENGADSLIDFKELPMPGTLETIDIEDFFIYLAMQIMEYECNDVGFCFSYPAIIKPDLDAEIIEFKKEIYIQNAAGRLVGEGINSALLKLNSEPKRFAVLNDTTAVLVGAAPIVPRIFDTGMALILGTGSNICYIEKGRIINTECGNFNLFPSGRIDTELNLASKEPELQHAEKMTAGRYLPEIINRIVTELGEECREEIKDEVYKRAARCVVSETAGILKHCGAGNSLPSYVAVEGSTFMKAEALQRYIYQYMKEYVNDSLGIDCRIVKAENTTLRGAALAALTQK